MGDEYALYSAQGNVVDFEGFAEPLEANAAVYEYAALFCSDKGGIALAGAEKGIKSCHWIFSVLLDYYLELKKF
jgi:hypothetical protein